MLARGSRIEVEDLPDEVRQSTPAIGSPGVIASTRTLADVERAHILSVVESVNGNRTKAASILGIGPATLFRKLKKYKLGEPVAQ